MQDRQPVQRYLTIAGTHLSQERGDFDFEGNDMLTGSKIGERRVPNPTAGNAEQDNSDNSQGEYCSQRQHLVRARVQGGEKGQQLTLGRGPTGSVHIMTHLNHREDNDVARLFHISN